MNIFTRIITAFALVFSFVGAPLVLSAQPVSAQSPEESLCKGSGGNWSNGKCTKGSRDLLGAVRQVSNILIFIVAAVSVVMIIIGGLRYAVSQGDQAAVSSAKNTIIYAVVGLIIAVAAFAVVNFVVVNIT
ncbi:MAG: hypothetical protein ACREGJ_04180 [Candidatus Saccharimonadales bacterium]